MGFLIGLNSLLRGLGVVLWGGVYPRLLFLFCECFSLGLFLMESRQIYSIEMLNVVLEYETLAHPPEVSRALEVFTV